MNARRTLRVLVVEDHPTMLDTMTQMIELLGHRAIPAACLADAQAIDAAEYDVLLCDYRLPDGEGPQLCDALRQRGVDVPMILLTAFDTRALTPEQTAGFAHILTKPLDMQELGNILRQLADANP